MTDSEALALTDRDAATERETVNGVIVGEGVTLGARDADGDGEPQDHPVVPVLDDVGGYHVHPEQIPLHDCSH